MDEYFSVKDLAAFSYIPSDKMDTLVEDLNRTMRFKVAGNNEEKWSSFLSLYPPGKNHGVMVLSPKKKPAKIKKTSPKKKKTRHEARAH